MLRLWLAAFVAAAAGWAVRAALPPLHPIPEAVAVLGAFGLAYFGAGAAMGLPEARRVLWPARR